MRLTRIIICAFLLISCIFSAVSCKELPLTSFTETDDVYSYTNISYGTHARHYLDLVIPKSASGDAGLVLYIHGGGWIGGDKEVYTDYLRQDKELGYISASINYRYADGKKVTCEDILDDITSALLKIKQTCADFGINVNKVLLAGGSAGAHLSLMYAYARTDESPIAPVAAVSYAGPTDLTDPEFLTSQYVEDIKEMIYAISGANLKRKSIEECKDELYAASPIKYVDSDTVPTLLCHGIKDDVVPYSNAEALYAMLKEFGVASELVMFPNSGHGLEADPDMTSYADELFRAYKEKYLK